MEHNTASNTTVCGTDNTSTTECRSISHTDATMTGVQHSIIRTSVELFEESPTLRSDLDRKVEVNTWLIGGARAVLSVLASATSGIYKSEQDALFAV